MCSTSTASTSEISFRAAEIAMEYGILHTSLLAAVIHIILHSDRAQRANDMGRRGTSLGLAASA